MEAFVGIDVAFTKRKRLPVCVCTWQHQRLIPLPLLNECAPLPPRGHGNVAAINPLIVASFADEVAKYLLLVEKHFSVSIKRIAIDAPSAPRGMTKIRRDAEIVLDHERISCFTTPSESDFCSIRAKVRQHLENGGAESRLPHANQLWMLAGFALFDRLRQQWECLEVYPQAIMRILGASSVHKSKKEGLSAQAIAIAEWTGWPDLSEQDPLIAIRKAVRAAPHDALDSYASAWIAALDPQNRRALGCAPDDVIWVPMLPTGNTPLAPDNLNRRATYQRDRSHSQA